MATELFPAASHESPMAIAFVPPAADPGPMARGTVSVKFAVLPEAVAVKLVVLIAVNDPTASAAASGLDVDVAGEIGAFGDAHRNSP
jgi:hypothetical protein